MDNKEFEALKQYAMPIVEWLKKNGHPYMQIVIDERQVRIVEDVIGIPMEKAG